MERNTVKRGASVAIVAAAILLLASCVATQERALSTTVGAPGFWRGLWHGFIAPIAFIVSLFSDTMRIYATPNTGRWYDFGYMLGIGGFSGGIFAGHRTRTRVVEKTYPVDTA